MKVDSENGVTKLIVNKILGKAEPIESLSSFITNINKKNKK